ncbi:hypothetical protein ACX8Z9_04820 [Arthrobacter halodurans]|uniref:Uncharacterized protein n=1 Tax=Arthrobacter halodurans TaxID=516699 RepID=A0ABV4UR70_9MICC
MNETQPTRPPTNDAAPEGITPAFRTAWWRLHAWAFGLYLAACAAAYVQVPLEAITMAGLGVVFGAMAMTISMVVAHWRALTLMPPRTWAGIAHLWGATLAWLLIYPASLVVGGIADGAWSIEPTVWIFGLVPYAFWAAPAIRALIVAGREASE